MRHKPPSIGLAAKNASSASDALAPIARPSGGRHPRPWTGQAALAGRARRPWRAFPTRRHLVGARTMPSIVPISADERVCPTLQTYGPEASTFRYTAADQ